MGRKAASGREFNRLSFCSLHYKKGNAFFWKNPAVSANVHSSSENHWIGNFMLNLKRLNRRLVQTFTLALFALLFFPLPVFCQFGPPLLPPVAFLDAYLFDDTNWLSDSGDAPIAFINLASVPEWSHNALLLDTTNALPAYLAYNIVETDGDTNLAFSAGAMMCVFICDWASADTNQNGTGPGDAAGDPAYLLAAGDFSNNSPDGLWAIWFDAGGTNIYFGGVSNSESTVFVSAPISWPSNSMHLIGLSYGATLFVRR
jgi:hypothetical protein